jgi:AraC-like DNA-binding protein
VIILIWVDKVKEAIDYIEDNLFESISAESVGKAINYAPSSFSNIFSAITGYSVGEYIRFRRLSCAANELETGEHSVTEMAFECGYETVEAFSKAFKRLFGCPPSRLSKTDSGYHRFSPISIDFTLLGGFTMKRNLIPDLLKVDWSDTQRQNEFVNSVVSALNALGERMDYDYVCAASGSAFRTSFSMPSVDRWNHGNYHVIHTPIIIEHTFKMLGYKVSHHIRGDYEADSRLIMDSIDRGFPVITLEGVINCADACVISGYDNDGRVLLGYSPFMNVEEDHKEAPDDTGYFRKSDWHDGFFAKGSKGRILILEGKCGRPDKKAIFAETLKLISRLIGEENLAPGQYNGLAAHKAFANALLTYTWDDNFEPYLNVMCNYKQYLDRQYAVKFFRDNDRGDLAGCYEKIAALSAKLGQIIPQDFSASDMFSSKDKLRPYCDVLLQICDLEERVLPLLD